MSAPTDPIQNPAGFKGMMNKGYVRTPASLFEQMEKNRLAAIDKSFYNGLPRMPTYEKLVTMIYYVKAMIYDITDLKVSKAPNNPKAVKKDPMHYLSRIQKHLEYIRHILGILRDTELFTGNDTADISDKIEEMSRYFKELMDKNPEMLTEQEYTDMNTLYDHATTLHATLKEVQGKHKPINAIAPPVVSAPAPSKYTPYVSQTLTGGRTRRKRKQTQRKQRKQTQRKQRKQRK
jgi:hypothetical protein